MFGCRATACFSYIEREHSPVTLHSGLGYRWRPVTFEAEMQTALTEPQTSSRQTVH